MTEWQNSRAAKETALANDIFTWLNNGDIVILLYLGSKGWIPPTKVKITASSEWSKKYSPEKIKTPSGYWLSLIHI